MSKGKPDCVVCDGKGWTEVGANHVDIDCPVCFPETVPIRSQISNRIKIYEAWTWECTLCGVGVIGDSDLEGAKAHTCDDPNNWIKPFNYEDDMFWDADSNVQERRLGDLPEGDHKEEVKRKLAEKKLKREARDLTIEES